MPGLTRAQRTLALAAFAALVLLVLVAPVAVLLLAAFARSWTGTVPSEWTTRHLQGALSGNGLASLSVSIQTALVAGLLAALVGTCAALAARGLPASVRAFIATVMHLPAAVPSVVVGLGILVAFSGPPAMLSGKAAAVIVAQTTLVLSFAYSGVSSAVTRLDDRLSQSAASLGASSARILTRIELPLLMPAIGASFGLALALAMGELGATIMVYPPSWRTLPVTIFTASDRGDLFNAAASTLVLVGATVVVLGAVARLATSGRRLSPASHRSRTGRRGAEPAPADPLLIG